MKDLEIRGAGNLLGGEQSGHIAGVGFDLYVRLVGEAVADFRGDGDEAPDRDQDRAAGRRPPAARLRPGRAAAARGLPEAGRRRRRGRPRRRSRPSCVDRYGAPPEPVRNLLEVARLRTVRPQAPASPTSACRATTSGSGPSSCARASSCGSSGSTRARSSSDALGTILVPKPMTARVGGQPLRDPRCCAGPATSSASVVLDDVAAGRPRGHRPRLAGPTVERTARELSRSAAAVAALGRRRRARAGRLWRPRRPDRAAVVDGRVITETDAAVGVAARSTR